MWRVEALILDLASAYRKFIKMIYAAGCRRLQFDDCTWGMLVDPMTVHMWGTDEATITQLTQIPERTTRWPKCFLRMRT